VSALSPGAAARWARPAAAVGAVPSQLGGAYLPGSAPRRRRRRRRRRRGPPKLGHLRRLSPCAPGRPAPSPLLHPEPVARPAAQQPALSPPPYPPPPPPVPGPALVAVGPTGPAARASGPRPRHGQGPGAPSRSASKSRPMRRWVSNCCS